MTTWPVRRPWQHFTSEDLIEALAIIERRPLDTFGADTVAALSAELVLRDPNNEPAPDSVGRGLAEQATASPGIERTS